MIDPTASVYPINDEAKYQGMDIRTRIAMAAMQGLLSNPEHRIPYRDESYSLEPGVIAESSLAYADALISALNKPGE